MTHNQVVAGSIPAGPTKNQALTFYICKCFFVCIQFAYYLINEQPSKLSKTLRLPLRITIYPVIFTHDRKQ